MKGLLFTYALTYGGAALSLYRPFYGLLIYICFAIIRPESLWHWCVPAGNYSRIVAIALLIGWVLNGCGNWRLGKGRAVLGCFVGFWCWALLSTLISAIFPERGFAFLESIAKILLPFIVGITVIDSISQIKQLAWTMAISVAYVALEMNHSYYSGFNQLHESGFAGMDNNCMAIQFVTAIGFMFFLGFAAEQWWQRLVAIFGTLLMINAIMFSFSRGGLLSLIVTGGVCFLLLPKRPLHYAVFALATAAGLRLAGPEVIKRFATSFSETETRDASAQSRLDLWSDCWRLMLREPLFGVGPDHFTYYAQYELGWGTAKEAHSLWFQTGAEIGFIGLGFLLAFYVITMGNLWPLTRNSIAHVDLAVPDIARMVIASLSGFFVASQFVSLEGLELPYYVTLVGAATLKVAQSVVVPALAPLPESPLMSQSPALGVR